MLGELLNGIHISRRVSIVPSTCDRMDEQEMLATLERYPSAIPDAVAVHFIRAAGFEKVSGL